MKRILLLMLSVVVSTMMMADDVTPEEALQQATQFVQNRAARGNGPRLAPGVQPKLTLASRVSDLYVFNMSDDAGFIIVSNDDCAIPVLGYSDSGSFDANNLPDNMRAWLQGYADEIAWAKANNVKPVANAPKRAALGSNINPLVITRWDQGAPYNAFCCLETRTSVVTGCVATAMAQVMYYTETQANNSTTTTTAEIPGYASDTKGYNMNAIPAGTTINWNKMKNYYSTTYLDGYTVEEAAAVAYLMLYCGVSVQMDYGPASEGGSGAAIAAVDWALKNYFGYNVETTQYLNRDSYTNENWEKIIYHEISNGRPVIYGGQAYRVVSGTPDPDQCAGHAFVCDGYKYENDNSYFHINWGWGGTSDDYFALSALEPADQGYGGVNGSFTGFNYQQEAVIGVQKAGADGTVANEVSTASGVAMRVVSVEFERNPTLANSEFNVYVCVKNNSTENYSGEVAVWESSVTSGTAYNYELAAGGSQHICLSVTAPETPETYKYNVLFLKGEYMHTTGISPPLTVYPISVSGSMNDYGWATFSSEYPLDFTNVSGLDAAYIVTGNTGTTINKNAVTKVPANTGLLLKGISGDFTVPVTLDEIADVSSNKLVAVNTATEVNAATAANATNYVLSVQNSNAVFAKINETNATVPAGHAYLTLTSATAPWFSLDGGDATGINEVDDIKRREGAFFDLSGRRVENPTKGVYIVNGRKVVIK